MAFELDGKVAILRFDDGKANAVGHTLIDDINDALDRAETDGAQAVLLCSREGMFSAGFDLKEFAKGIEAGLVRCDTAGAFHQQLPLAGHGGSVSVPFEMVGKGRLTPGVDAKILVIKHIGFTGHQVDPTRRTQRSRMTILDAYPLSG